MLKAVWKLSIQKQCPYANEFKAGEASQQKRRSGGSRARCDDPDPRRSFLSLMRAAFGVVIGGGKFADREVRGYPAQVAKGDSDNPLNLLGREFSMQ